MESHQVSIQKLWGGFHEFLVKPPQVGGLEWRRRRTQELDASDWVAYRAE